MRNEGTPDREHDLGLQYRFRAALVYCTVPPDVSPEEALFLLNLETAVNFMMDGRPMLGEKVIVFGQGIVGLLTTALLALHPLTPLMTLDRHPLRRRFSLMVGADTQPRSRRTGRHQCVRRKRLCKDYSASPGPDRGGGMRRNTHQV